MFANKLAKAGWKYNVLGVHYVLFQSGEGLGMGTPAFKTNLRVTRAKERGEEEESGLAELGLKKKTALGIQKSSMSLMAH